MFVIKRNGKKAPVQFDKITARISKLCYGLGDKVQPVLVAQKVCAGVYPDVTTAQLDDLAAETAAYLSTDCPAYSILAARIAVSNLHKLTKKSFTETMKDCHEYVNPKNMKHSPLLSDEVMAFINENCDTLDNFIHYEKDLTYDFFAFKTLERSYLLRLNGQIVERPQHMIMRVACGIHTGNMERVLETYTLMSEKWFTHASPTLFNAGTPQPQLSSCFLLQMTDDSIEGIYETLKRCALISKTAGGIGLSIHNIRASNSYIAGTNGSSNGIVPMLRVFNDTARYVDQGGGKRKGAFAIYMEPWHADIFDFLDLKKNHGKEEARARDLFYAMWTPDLFMKRVKAEGSWALFCPNECPGLSDCWGAEFEALYCKYEAAGKARKTVPAQKLWVAIMESQMETGTPYMLYKDHANSKSNQQNLGTIKCSNLCTEIVEYTSPDEVAVCNLASISLKKFVKDGEFDHNRLYEITRVVTYNLNRVIDINYYPIPEAANSNLKHRPIGIGIQGMADAFCELRLAYETPGAAKLNREIFETIYFAALSESCALAQRDGTYASYEGSPVSKGVLQPDMWGVTPSDRWDWTALRASIAEHGVRNSLLLAPMPTASTAQILGNNESFEPFTSNMYTRRVLSGEFTVVNKYLLNDLTELGLWPRLKNQLIAHNGSVQNIPEVPDELKVLYKTAWEIKQKVLIDMAAERGAFIDQSQSLNIFMQSPNLKKLTSMHFYCWRRGLKTGMYYMRTKAAVDAIKFTVDVKALAQTGGKAEEVGPVDVSKVMLGEELNKPEECLSCGA